MEQSTHSHLHVGGRHKSEEACSLWSPASTSCYPYYTIPHHLQPTSESVLMKPPLHCDSFQKISSESHQLMSVSYRTSMALFLNIKVFLQCLMWDLCRDYVATEVYWWLIIDLGQIYVKASHPPSIHHHYSLPWPEGLPGSVHISIQVLLRGFPRTGPITRVVIGEDITVDAWSQADVEAAHLAQVYCVPMGE